MNESLKKLKIMQVWELVKLELSKLAFKLTHDLLPTKLAKCMVSDARGRSLEKIINT